MEYFAFLRCPVILWTRFNDMKYIRDGTILFSVRHFALSFFSCREDKRYLCREFAKLQLFSCEENNLLRRKEENENLLGWLLSMFCFDSKKIAGMAYSFYSEQFVFTNQNFFFRILNRYFAGCLAEQILESFSQFYFYSDGDDISVGRTCYNQIVYYILKIFFIYPLNTTFWVIQKICIIVGWWISTRKFIGDYLMMIV